MKRSPILFDVDDIADQVRRNCSISDAKYAGLFSICGLALRLRDLFKWERGLDPWVEKESGEVLEWIGSKEEAWETLAEEEFEEIRLAGRAYDPFDTGGINSVLSPQGFFYGAGYARGLKPTFFLSTIESRKENDGLAIHILGRELARDLLTIPALTQDDGVLVRMAAARFFLWDQIAYINPSGRLALKFALARYGVDEKDSDGLRNSFNEILDHEKETYIHHELGEIRETVFDRMLWKEMVAEYPHSSLELLARAVKDLLADTSRHGTLGYIIRARQPGSLGFYVAFQQGLLKALFPEIRKSFQEFTDSGSWHVVQQAVSHGFNTGKAYADRITEIYLRGKQKNDPQWVEKEINDSLLEPLLKNKG